MKTVKNFLIGVFLAVMGFLLFFRNVTFSDPSNTGFMGSLMGMLFGQSGPKAASGVFIIVICIAFLLFAFSPNGWTAGLIGLSVVVIIMLLVSSLQMKIAEIGGVEMVIIMAMLLGGIGLAARAAIQLAYPDKKEA